jgi:DNA-binding MarR family transcriptional regulator
MNEQGMQTGETEDFLSTPGHLLRRCQQIGVAIFLDECRAFDLTPLQFSVLAALARFGDLDQVSLGGVTALDRTTTLVVLNKLEERGLTTRTSSQKDRRSKIVAITDEGRTVLQRIWPSVKATQERILAPLSPRERTQLTTLLSKIADENNEQSRAPHRMP